MRALDDLETRRALQALRLDRPSGIGFAVRDPARDTLFDWHEHDYHQLMYAVAGPSQLETALGRHVVPQGRAAWIPARIRHRSLISGPDGASLFFAPEAVPDRSGRIRIVVASPLMREMVMFAMRWPLGASETDPMAQSFFRALAMLCGEWLASELPLFLPGATHPGIRRAMDGAAADLGNATQRGALAAANMSERNFRRLFRRETGMTWQGWLGHARMLMAMGLLTEGRRVTDVAADMGYASLSAFAKTFAHVAGEPPARFRRRQHVRRTAGGD